MVQFSKEDINFMTARYRGCKSQAKQVKILAQCLGVKRKDIAYQLSMLGYSVPTIKDSDDEEEY